MSIKWKLFRILCLLQMLSASFFTIVSLIGLFQHFGLPVFARLVLFLLVLLLSIFSVNLLNNNYPDIPVAGAQKTRFNRLFLLNFIFLIFLFGIVVGDIRHLRLYAELLGAAIFKLPLRLLITPVVNFITLVFQLIILYGLYVLRLELYINFHHKQFEFEKDQPA